MEPYTIKDPSGKLGVLIVGLNGAVSTTFLAGLMAVRKGQEQPIGSLTQMGTIRIGKRSEDRFPYIKDFVPLAELKDMVFGGWDIRNENCYESAYSARVLDARHIEQVRDELEKIRPMPGVFDKKYVPRLDGTWTKKGDSKFEKMEQLREDIRLFRQANNLDRMVVVWCGSTEVYLEPGEIHSDLKKFVLAMKRSHNDISPSMLYAYASVSEGVPFINGAPNLSTEIPALMQLARQNKIPLAGKDYKTGQTMMKTVIAPMLKARMLGLNGWFSSNILGNRDGEVLDDPGSFKTKEASKLSVLEGILQPELYPQLYGSYYHKVRINYYPPSGDNKEGWDNIDIFGWLGYTMQLKIDFLCRDSILAAPIVLDLILFIDLAQRSGMHGIQEWLSFYFKSPMHEPDKTPEHDLFIQLLKLKNKLRYMMGEKPLTHIEEVNGIEEAEVKRNDKEE